MRHRNRSGLDVQCRAHGVVFAVATLGLVVVLCLSGVHLAAALQDNSVGIVRTVSEQSKVLTVLSIGRRMPGFTVRMARTQKFTMLPSYGAAIIRDVMKTDERRKDGVGGVYQGALATNLNFVVDAAIEGQGSTLLFNDPHFVLEYKQPTGNVDAGGGGGAPAGDVEERRRGPAGPMRLAWTEAGTELRIIGRQVFGQGIRPIAPDGGYRAMLFIRMPTVTPADQLKVWQALHAKALESNAAFAKGLVGLEVVQRLGETPPTQVIPGRGDVPLPDLIVSFWTKSPQLTVQFEGYVQALRESDQQKVIDAPSTFFLIVDEQEIWLNPSFEG